MRIIKVNSRAGKPILFATIPEKYTVEQARDIIKDLSDLLYKNKLEPEKLIEDRMYDLGFLRCFSDLIAGNPVYSVDTNLWPNCGERYFYLY